MLTEIYHNNHEEIQKILTLATSWCLLHLIFVIIRFPFSKEKIGRIKLFLKGVLSIIGFLVSLAIFCIATKSPWFEKPIVFDNILHTVLLLIMYMCYIISFFITLSFALGQMMYFLMSWASDDFEVWSENH